MHLQGEQRRERLISRASVLAASHLRFELVAWTYSELASLFGYNCWLVSAWLLSAGESADKGDFWVIQLVPQGRR